MKLFFTIIFLLSAVLTLHSQDYNSEVLSHISYRFASKNKLIRVDTVTLQINSRAGDNNALIVIPFSKREKLSVDDAWIEDCNGNIIRKLKRSEVKQQSAISDFSLYEDDFIKYFELKHNIYPYKIVYCVTHSTSDFFSIINWQASYNSSYPIRNMRFIVNIPLDYTVRYTQKNAKPPVIDTVGSNKILTWHISYTPVSKQKNAPVSALMLPQVNVVPIDFKFGKKGSWQSWQSFGNWVHNLNNKLDKLPDGEKTKIDRLLHGITDKREKTKILYYYLQDYTRYINVSINLGGFKSYPASYVAQNKYGDCKALSNYMVAMLRYAGIESYYTLIKSGDEIKDIDKNFPSQVFDHAIVTVPFENDTVFLECTSKNFPFGYLGTFTQGREGLIIMPSGNSCFIATPQLNNYDVLCTRKINAPINMATSEVDMQLTLRGDNYEQYTLLASGINRNIAERHIRNHILQGSFELLEYQFDKKNRDTATIGFNAKLRIPEMTKRYGDKLLLSSFSHDVDMYEDPQKRTQALQFDYPVFYQDTIVYISGKSLDKTTINDKLEINTKFGNYTKHISIDGNKITAIKTILINKGRYQLTDYEQFYNFITTIRNNEKKNIYINQ